MSVSGETSEPSPPQRGGMLPFARYEANSHRSGKAASIDYRKPTLATSNTYPRIAANILPRWGRETARLLPTNIRPLRGRARRQVVTGV